MLAKLVKGTGFLYLGYFLGGAGQLLGLKALAVRMGPGELGLFFALWALGMLIGELTKLGLGLALPHFVPKHEARGRPKEARAFLGLVLLTQGGAGGLAVLVGFAVSVLIKNPYTSLLPLALAAGALAGSFSLGVGGLIAWRRMALAGLMSGIAPLALAGGYWLWPGSLTPQRALWVCLLVYSAFGALAWLTAKPSLVGLRRALGEARDYLLYGAASGLLGPVFSYADRALTGLFLPIGQVAVLGVVRKLDWAGRSALAVPMGAAAPHMSKAHYSGQPVPIVRLGRLYWATAALGLALVPSVGPWLISVASSAHYSKAAPFLYLLWAGTVVGALWYPYSTLARSIGAIRAYFAAEAAWVGAYLGFLFLLTPWLGLWGTCSAPLLGSLVGLLVAGFTVFRAVGQSPKGLDVALALSAIGLGALGLIVPPFALLALLPAGLGLFLGLRPQ